MSTPISPAVTAGTYAKSLIYVALAVVGFAVTAFADDMVSTEEVLNAVVIALGAFVVYLVPNLPAGVAAYAKGVAAFATAAVVAVISFLSGGVTVSEWLQVGIAAFAAVGVIVVPNKTTR